MMYSLKIVLLIFVATAAIIKCQACDDPHKEVREKCANQYGVNLEKLKTGNEHPENFKCHIYCYLKGLEIMNKTGTIYPRVGVSAITPKLRDKFRPKVYSCADETKEEKQPCIHAYKFLICVTNNNPKTTALFGVFDKPHMSS